MPPKQKQNADSRLETLKREIAELRDKGDVEKEKFVLYGQCIEAIDARIAAKYERDTAHAKSSFSTRIEKSKTMVGVKELKDKFVLMSDHSDLLVLEENASFATDDTMGPDIDPIENLLVDTIDDSNSVAINEDCKYVDPMENLLVDTIGANAIVSNEDCKMVVVYDVSASKAQLIAANPKHNGIIVANTGVLIADCCKIVEDGAHVGRAVLGQADWRTQGVCVDDKNKYDCKLDTKFENTNLYLLEESTIHLKKIKAFGCTICSLVNSLDGDYDFQVTDFNLGFHCAAIVSELNNTLLTSSDHDIAFGYGCETSFGLLSYLEYFENKDLDSFDGYFENKDLDSFDGYFENKDLDSFDGASAGYSATLMFDAVSTLELDNHGASAGCGPGNLFGLLSYLEYFEMSGVTSLTVYSDTDVASVESLDNG
jgi:hypothetical protein